MTDQLMDTTTEQMPQSSQVTSPKPEISPQVPKNNKTQNKLVFFLIAIFLLIIGGSYFALQKVVKSKMTPTDSGTVEYATGLPLDHVSVQIPNDEDIDHYPLCQFTVPSVNVYLNQFEGLTVYRGTDVEPGLAESWTNPDPKTWRFKLRKGVKFHSGDLFTAKDVKYTIDQAKASANDKIPWVSQPMAARIDSVKVVDDYTVELKTKEPDATLLRWLIYIGIVSKDQVTRDGLSNSVGTGPYKLTSLTKREATLQANTGYWDKVANVKKLTYKVIPDPKEAKKQLENGSLDIITLFLANNKDLINKGFQYENVRTGSVNWLVLDINSAKSKYVTGTDKNPFKDIRVRKAIQLAFDLPKLISDSGLNAESVTQFATPELVGFNPNLKAPVQNITEAKRLMGEAGFPNGFTVILDGDNQEDHVRLYNQIKKQLAVIGITVKPRVDEAQVYFDKLGSVNDFSMIYMFYYPDTVDSLDFLNTIFHTKTGSQGVWNVNNYSNKQVDQLIDQAESTFTVDDRINLTRQTHALILQDLASIPLYTETNGIYSRDNIVYKPSITAINLGYTMSGRQKISKQ